MSNDPWCIIGDFNDHLSTEDKRGGPDRAPWLIRGFQNAVNDCQLHDLPLHGYQFTWFKSLGTTSAKEARLDRALVTAAWNTMYPQASLQTLVAPISDHTPLLLQLDPVLWRKPNHSFRFNNAWLLEPDFVQNVQSNWEHYPASNIINKLEYCVEDILSWSKNNSPNFRQQINQHRSRIESIRQGSDDSSDLQIPELQKNLATLLVQEDSYWRQRSKVFWLKDGDTNNKFFHASASARRRKNMISKLRDPNNGNWITSHDDL
ncbi:endonuclease/exonuclease/phosphatase family protein, partial [Trifolium medium]|nr:endonuclease/exonuclease/phosphatase family protein [Trifolium medium]